MEETKGEQINSPFKKDLILRQELAHPTYISCQSIDISVIFKKFDVFFGGWS